MIEIHDLTKRYGDFTAVDGLSLTAAPGAIFGFLGPNGAGKTTTIRIVAGLSLPTSGSVAVNGIDVIADPVRAKSVMGYVPDRPRLARVRAARDGAAPRTRAQWPKPYATGSRSSIAGRSSRAARPRN